mmetsp:Transcript_18503/g.49660  ORF Transcript_18503/g.49660 Transcript_18503/m.49660 type:complete len:211 (+) Transcript_18503:526-1158(+)
MGTPEDHCPSLDPRCTPSSSRRLRNTYPRIPCGLCSPSYQARASRPRYRASTGSPSSARGTWKACARSTLAEKDTPNQCPCRIAASAAQRPRPARRTPWPSPRTRSTGPRTPSGRGSPARRVRAARPRRPSTMCSSSPGSSGNWPAGARSTRSGAGCRESRDRQHRGGARHRAHRRHRGWAGARHAGGRSPEGWCSQKANNKGNVPHEVA